MTTKPQISSFNTLADIMIQSYERYLPGAFDESLTILEKVNKIIEHLNRIGKLSNDVVEQWNNVMEWVMNDGLSETVLQRLDEMTADGTLDQIINVNLMNKKVEKGSLVLNIRDFGAVGDGITDDTQAIQDAIDSLPLNSTDYGVLSPKGFANGGTILIPRGRYKITQSLILKRGIRIIGNGRESSQIISFCTSSVLKYNDEGRYTQDEIVVKDLSIWQDASVIPTGGAGIETFIGPASVQSIGVIFENLYIEGTFRGILLGAGVACSVKNVYVNKAVNNGIEQKFTSGTTSVSTTSTTYESCYVALSGNNGFHIERGAYCSFVSCASDSNNQYGYYFDSGHAHSMLACGAEENQVGGIYLKNTEGILVNVDIVYSLSTGDRYGARLNDAKNTTFLAGRFANIQASNLPAINVVLNGGNVVILGTQFEGLYSGNIIDSVYKVLHLTGDNGLVGYKNNWGIGVTQQPDPTTTFQVGGNADNDVTTIQKVDGTFTGAGALRNVAQWVQAITADNTANYPLLISQFIPNASKGTQSTVQRSAGQMIVEQTRGTTANANIMIDAGQGTVPSGDWDMYSGSTRNSFFKGNHEYETGKGVVLKSPNGTRYRLTVSDTGTVSATLA